MTTMHIKQTYLYIFLWMLPAFLIAQPVLSTRQQIEGVDIYPDFKQEDVYYYAPAKLTLGTDPNGKPQFQLVQMRYTGTACANDQGDKHFLNLAQFTVKMVPIETAVLSSIQASLKKGRITPELRPIPIRYIESYLVAPVGKNPEGQEQFKRIGSNGGFEADASSASGKTYWHERVFTLKLENYESQILWKQVSEGSLSISFGYAFYADAVLGRRVETVLSGDSSFTSQMEDAAEAAAMVADEDTTVSPQIIRSNAFPIYIDVEKWPESLKKLDINEGMPPAYPALQIACYDFSDELRPDLALKKIEVEAIGVGGQPLKPVSVRFSPGKAELNNLNLHFPFAVRMDRPMRYRVIEFTRAGERSMSSWTEKESCSELIDITTKKEKNDLVRHYIELEVDQELMQERKLKTCRVAIRYHWAGQARKQIVELHASDPLPLQELRFIYNKTQTISYQVAWEHEDGNIERGPKMELKTNYYFLSPPEPDNTEINDQ